MLSVRELIGDLDVTLLAGEAQLDAPVRWVHISELPDPTPWLSGGELLLTTGMALETEDDQRAYVQRLADHGLAGLGVGTGFRHERVPDALVEAAARAVVPALRGAVRDAVHRRHGEGVLAARERAVRRPAAFDRRAGAPAADRPVRARARRDRRRARDARRRRRAGLRRPRRAVGAAHLPARARARGGRGAGRRAARPGAARRRPRLRAHPGRPRRPRARAARRRRALRAAGVAGGREGHRRPRRVRPADPASGRDGDRAGAAAPPRRRDDRAAARRRRPRRDRLRAAGRRGARPPARAVRPRWSRHGARARARGALPRPPARRRSNEALREEAVSSLVAAEGPHVCALLPGLLDDELFELAGRASREGRGGAAPPGPAGAGRAVAAGEARRAFHEARCALEARQLGANGSGPRQPASRRSATSGRSSCCCRCRTPTRCACSASRCWARSRAARATTAASSCARSRRS